MRAYIYLAKGFVCGAKGKRFIYARGAIIAIALSLVPLILVLQVTNGMIEGITARFIETSTYHLQLKYLRDNNLFSDMLSEQLASLEHVDFITSAMPERQDNGLIASNKGNTSTLIRAISAELWDTDVQFQTYMNVHQGVFDLSDIIDDNGSMQRSIVLGSAIADKLSVQVGDEVRLMTMRSIGKRYFPRITRFIVRAIVSTGYHDLDKFWVFINYKYSNLLVSKNKIDFIGIKITDPFAIKNGLFMDNARNNDISDPILQKLYPYVQLGWRISTWFDLSRNQYLLFANTKYTLIFIMILIMGIASINVSSSMIMMVIEKEYDIAFLRSMGASVIGMYICFVSAGLFIAVIGSVIGLLLGIVLSLGINEIVFLIEKVINGILFVYSYIGYHGEFVYLEIFNPDIYLEHIPIQIYWREIFLAGSVSIVIATIASLLPAYKAVRLKPLQILRKR